MLTAQRIDSIRRTIDEGEPHIGGETEGIVTDPQSLDVVHHLGDTQPVQAVKQWVEQQGEAGRRAARSITPDIPETTIEANPLPLRSPRSTAAAQRLMNIVMEGAIKGLTPSGRPVPCLLHGASLRPPYLTTDDASTEADPFKRFYYQYQIGVHGDKVGAAAGDHLNFSAPWLGHQGEAEISRKMIEMTARMRLIGGALSIALSASSPLHFGADSGSRDPVYGTSLTPWESARLGHVWPGRTIMDVSGLFRNPVSFRRTMARFAENGTLLSGRDVWLVVRAQSAPVDEGPGFEELCADLSLDLSSHSDRDRARKLLLASFRSGPKDRENGYYDDPQWQALERWRQERLDRLIRAPRNRVEVRTLETPPAFGGDSPGGDYTTPYEYLRSVHTFLEMLFIHLSENPPFVEDLEYGELELQAAKRNEHAVLLGGLDAVIRWIPRNMRATTPRAILRKLLNDMKPLADGLDRWDDLAIVREIAERKALPPAARIRAEVADWYGIDVDLRHNARLLPDDDYPRMLLERTRQGLKDELAQIQTDIPTVPAADRAYLEELLGLAQSAWGSGLQGVT
jgi:hypothetical protein